MPSKVNKHIVALALESAVNKHALDCMNNCRKSRLHFQQHPSSDLTKQAFRSFYWEKVHDVVASIRGKHDDKPGSIVPMVLDGHFPTACDVVKLIRKKLHQSFEGKIVCLE